MDVMVTAMRKTRRRTHGGRALLSFFATYYIQWLLVLSVIILSAANPYFRTIPNLANILLQGSFAGIAAAGMTLLIISGVFDLSVAGLLGLCAVALVEVLPSVGVVPAILICLLLGVVLGILNGIVVTKLRIPAFVATLGMMNIYLAFGFIWTEGQVISFLNVDLQRLGTGTLFGVLPVPFLMMVGTYLCCYGILNKTIYGRSIRAVGSSEVAAKTSGLPVDLIRIFAFAILGGCTALAAVFLTAVLSSANAIMASGFELTVIATVVIGGTSLRGGQGTLFGSFAGALFFAVISSALNIFNVGAYWQYVVTGVFLISALGVQALRSRVLDVE
jgi:ribose transport system permease protein